MLCNGPFAFTGFCGLLPGTAEPGSIRTPAVTVAAGRTGTAGRLLRKIVLGDKTLDLDEGVAAGEVQAALIVDLADLDDDLVAHVHNVLHLLGALDVQLADVD